MKPKQYRLAMGILLIAFLSSLLPSGAVQAQDGPTSERVLYEHTYDIGANYSYLGEPCKQNMLVTLWSTNPGSKYDGAYKDVPSDFTGSFTFKKGEYWLNGIFGPYDNTLGWTDVPKVVGGSPEGGCACDIMSMIAETLDHSGIKVVPDSTVSHLDLGKIPGVSDQFAFAVYTYRLKLDWKAKNGQDIQVRNPYDFARLEWIVQGDEVTLRVISTDSAEPPNDPQPAANSPQPAPEQDDSSNTTSIPTAVAATIPWYTQVNWWLLVGILVLIALGAWIWRITHPGLQFNKWYRDEKKKREQTVWGRTLWLWWKIWGAIYAAIFIGYVARLALPHLREIFPDPQGTWELQFTVPNWTIYMTPVVILLVVLVRSAARRARWQPQWLLLPPPEEQELTGKQRRVRAWAKWILVVLLVSGLFVLISRTGGQVDAGVSPTPRPMTITSDTLYAGVYGAINGWGTLGETSSAAGAVQKAQNYAAGVRQWYPAGNVAPVVNVRYNYNDQTIKEIIRLCTGSCIVMVDIALGEQNVSTLIDRYAPLGDHVWIDVDLEHRGVKTSASEFNSWAAHYFAIRQKQGFTSLGVFAFYDFRGEPWLTPPSQVVWQYENGLVIPIYDGFSQSRETKFNATKNVLSFYSSAQAVGIMEFKTKWGCGSQYGDCGFTLQEYYEEFKPLLFMSQ